MNVMGRYKRIFRCRRCGQSALVINKGFKWSNLTRPFRRLKATPIVPVQSDDPKQRGLFTPCK